MDDPGSQRNARISSRKRCILDVLDRSAPPGLILLNELRHTVLRMERQSGSDIAVFDFNRSFNRTVLQFGAPHFHQIFLDVKESDALTAGIVARFGVWQVVEKGYVSALPDSHACAVVIGRDTFSVLATLVDRTRALIYSGEVERIGMVSSDGIPDAQALHQVGGVPWALYGVNHDQKLVGVTGAISVRQLNPLPDAAVWEDGTEQCLKRRQNDFLFDR